MATEPYKLQAHGPHGTICGKTYCLGCGLVYLNNELTRWSIRMGCNSADPPGYREAIQRYSRRRA